MEAPIPTESQIATAKAIADTLGETETIPCQQILRAVCIFGEEKAVKLANTAIKMEGKMLKRDGKPRTVGGNFFDMLRYMREKKQITGKQLKWILAPRYAEQFKAQKAQAKG